LKTSKPLRLSEFDVKNVSLSSRVCETRNRHQRHSSMKLSLVQHCSAVFVAYRVPKCDVTKKFFFESFEIMVFTEILRKYMMKNVYLPKINILLQFGDEILAHTNHCNFVLVLTPV